MSYVVLVVVAFIALAIFAWIREPYDARGFGLSAETVAKATRMRSAFERLERYRQQRRP